MVDSNEKILAIRVEFYCPALSIIEQLHKEMERQGYVPLKLEVVNEKRGDVETLILYKQCCEEIFGQGNVTDMS